MSRLSCCCVSVSPTAFLTDFDMGSVDVIAASYDGYDRLCSGCRRKGSGSRPGLGSDVLDLPVGHEWEPCEYIAQVGVRIDAAGAATLDDGVEDGAALAVDSKMDGQREYDNLVNFQQRYQKSHRIFRNLICSKNVRQFCGSQN